MPFCIQCGEDIRLETARCPSCGRLVGASSIGLARERQARPALRRAVLVALLAFGGLALAFGSFRLLGRTGGVANEVLVAASQQAASSVVRVSTSRTDDVGGVIVRALGSGLVVATEEAVGAPGRLVEVSFREERTRGAVLLVGRGQALGALALVLVPDPPAGAEPAAIARALPVDASILALNANASLATAGHVLSFDDDLVLVHDAPVVAAARGYGLWSTTGRLAALSSLPREAGDNVAVAAFALAARLLVYETTLPAGAVWVAPRLPIPAGASLAVFARGAGAADLALRFGDRATPVKARSPWTGVVLAEVASVPARELQLGRASGSGGADPLAITVVALAPGDREGG